MYSEVIATLDECVVSSGGPDIDMGRCDYEEADTRIAVHVLHSLEHGQLDCSFVHTIHM